MCAYGMDIWPSQRTNLPDVEGSDAQEPKRSDSYQVAGNNIRQQSGFYQYKNPCNQR